MATHCGADLEAGYLRMSENDHSRSSIINYLIAQTGVALQYSGMILRRTSLDILVMSIFITCTSCSEHEDQIIARNSAGETFVTLYAHEFNGAVPAHLTPGILNCDPDIANARISQKLRMLESTPLSRDMILPRKRRLIEEATKLFELSRSTFLPLADANWNEGHSYTVLERQKAASAMRFARQHNRLAFQEGKMQILRLCPDAKLDGN